MNTLLVKNKKAELNFEILNKIEAGISLFGFEVKSLKAQQGSFADSFVTISNGEVFLKNFYIPPFQEKNTPAGYDKYRDRKLLIHKKEIRQLEKKLKEAGKTLIPLEFYSQNGKIKLLFALASGLKKHDKREKLKEKAIKRDMERSLKNLRF